MIKDNLQHLAYYNYLNQDIKTGLKYVRDTDFDSLENGRYDIAEGKIFAVIQDYDSKPEFEGKFEAHRKYVDIQFIIKGEERMGTGKVEDFEETTQYDEEKDVVFLTPNESAQIRFITVKEREFAIFYPADAHMPSIAVQEPNFVRKVIVKVLVWFLIIKC